MKRLLFVSMMICTMVFAVTADAAYQRSNANFNGCTKLNSSAWACSIPTSTLYPHASATSATMSYCIPTVPTNVSGYACTHSATGGFACGSQTFGPSGVGCWTLTFDLSAWTTHPNDAPYLQFQDTGGSWHPTPWFYQINYP